MFCRTAFAAPAALADAENWHHPDAAPHTLSVLRIGAVAMFRTLALLCLALAAGTPARAFTEEVVNAVDGHPTKTYLDLVRTLVPDLRREEDSGVGETVIPLRHIRQGYGGRPPTSVDVRTVEAIPFRGEGRDGTLLYVHLGRTDDRPETVDALAYFDEKLRLVDAVEVGMGEYAGFSGSPLRISKWNDAIVLWSLDSNSESSHEQFSLAYLRNGRFQVMDTLPLHGNHGCGWARYQEIEFKPVPEPGDGFWPVEVTVNETQSQNLTATCEDPLPEPHAKSAKTTYRWDGLRDAYRPEDDALPRFVRDTVSD